MFASHTVVVDDRAGRFDTVFGDCHIADANRFAVNFHFIRVGFAFAAVGCARFIIFRFISYLRAKTFYYIFRHFFTKIEADFT